VTTASDDIKAFLDANENNIIGLNADGSFKSVLVGLGLTAHNNGTVASATFDHVSVVTAARLTDTQNNQASSLFDTQKVPITGASPPPGS